jgi:hypothetical protein
MPLGGRQALLQADLGTAKRLNQRMLVARTKIRERAFRQDRATRVGPGP